MLELFVGSTLSVQPDIPCGSRLTPSSRPTVVRESSWSYKVPQGQVGTIAIPMQRRCGAMIK